MKKVNVILLIIVAFALGALVFNTEVVFRSPSKALTDLSKTNGVEISKDTLNVYPYKEYMDAEDVKNLYVLKKHFIVRIY